MRYEIGPLEERLAGQDLFRALKISKQTLASYHANGISTLQADRLAVRVGLHPSEVWPTWYDDAENEDRCPWCGVWSFDRRYCDEVERRMHEKEWRRDMTRTRNWWKRLDRYRHTTGCDTSGLSEVLTGGATASTHNGETNYRKRCAE